MSFETKFSQTASTLIKNVNHCDPTAVRIWRDYIPEPDEIVFEHWLDFEKPSSCAFSIIGFLHVAMLVASTIGNGLVLLLFFKHKHLRTPSNYLIANLAVADLFENTNTAIIAWCAYKPGYVINYLECQLYGWFGGLGGVGAIMSIAMMSIDRYNVISNPLNPRRLTKTTAKILITFIWMYAFTFPTLPFIIGFQPFIAEGYLISCTFDYLSDNPLIRKYLIGYICCGWLIPMTLIVLSYTGIVLAVRKNAKTLRAISERNNASTDGSKSGTVKFRENEKREDIQIAKVALTLISVWLFAWTPHVACALFGINGRKDLITATFSIIPAIGSKLAAIVDPWIYALTHPRFKQEMTKLFGSNKKKKIDSDDTATIQTTVSGVTSNTDTNTNSETA